MSSEIMIVAAEASSELYAFRIIEEVRKRGLTPKFFGIGSQRMEAVGCETIERSEKMAVVGLMEVLSHWKTIAQAFKNLVSRAQKTPPQVAVLLDYPDFNLRLAKKLNKMNIPVVYYISPQVWAWRKNRVHFIKKAVSKMLVVFPFEEDFYKQYDVPVTFVGHPLLDEAQKTKLSDDERKRVRAQMGILPDHFLVGLLPGSRESELKHCFLTQLKTLEIIAEKKSNTQFLILVAPTLSVEQIRNRIPKDFKIPIRVVQDDPFKILQICDSTIVASGTATLMTGLAETPMVIMYKMNKITGFLAKKLVKGPKFFGMANLILDEKVVPELFQDEATPEALANLTLKYINDEPYRQSVKNKLSQIKNKLGFGGATKKVVDVLERYIQ